MLLGQARSTCWRKWAEKHENEELKEGIWLEPALALLRKKTKEGWTDKQRNVARKLVLEGGCGKHVTKRKGQKSIDFTIALNGTRLDVRCQRLSESGSKKREPQRRNGSGNEIL